MAQFTRTNSVELTLSRAFARSLVCLVARTPEVKVNGREIMQCSTIESIMEFLLYTFHRFRSQFWIRVQRTHCCFLLCTHIPMMNQLRKALMLNNVVMRNENISFTPPRFTSLHTHVGTQAHVLIGVQRPIERKSFPTFFTSCAHTHGTQSTGPFQARRPKAGRRIIIVSSCE